MTDNPEPHVVPTPPSELQKLKEKEKFAKETYKEQKKALKIQVKAIKQEAKRTKKIAKLENKLENLKKTITEKDTPPSASQESQNCSAP